MNIAAIATPYGVGAISIVRATGPDCIKMLSKVFTLDLSKVKSHTIHYGYIMDGNEIVDEVMVSVMKAPRTFTKEDSVEINCHGGLYVTNRVLETLLKNGFRLADPGEFTKRAFLNKRIDMIQAEAIMDIISAENKSALKIAHQNLRKETTILIEKLREDIVDILAQIEVHIDYPEYDDVEVLTDKIVLPRIKELINKFEILLQSSQVGKTLVSGVTTAIIGKPNVGKSSLLNYLLEEDKAIVSNVAGTTRDIVEGSINLGNITLKLIDTAGIRKSIDKIEKIGIDKSKKVINDADLVLLVIDPSNFNKEDEELLKLTENSNRIIIVNKSDLNKEFKLDEEYILLSAKNKVGIENLIDKISKDAQTTNYNNKHFLTNARQIGLLENSLEALKQASNQATLQMPIDIIAIDIHTSYQKLGEILGVYPHDDFINQLFEKFCLGK